MKWFVVLTDTEISNLMTSESGLPVSKPVPIITDDEIPIDTGYRILGTREQYANSLSGYVKYTEEQIGNIITLVKSGKKVVSKTQPTTKQSAFLDPEGAKARYTGLGIVNSDNNECVWTATSDMYITGVKFHVTGAEEGDTVDFEVHHPTAGLLDGFASKWYIWDGTHDENVYPARIYTGLQILVRLNKGTGNTGNTRVLINGRLHEIPTA